MLNRGRRLRRTVGRRCAGEFDGTFHSFAAGTGEEHLQPGDDFRVIMSRVVNTTTGEKIQNGPPLRGREFNAQTTGELHVKFKKLQPPYPLGIT